jgi:hypothetical protein
MKFEIGAMSVGDILDRGLKIFLARLPTFYAINFIVLAPLLLYQVVMPAFLFDAQTGGAPPEMMLAFLGGSLGVLLLMLILIPIGQAATLHVIGQEFIDERVGVGAALRFAAKRFLTLLGVSILLGFILFAGMLLCVVPYFIFLTWYAFSGQVVVMEGLAGMNALNRSKDLGKDSYGRIFGLLALLFVISLIAAVVNSVLNQVFKPMEVVATSTGPRFVLHSYGLYALAQTVNFLLSVAVQSYTAVCLTLMYFDLRIRKEGFDLELAARQHAGKDSTSEQPAGENTRAEGPSGEEPGLP